MVVCNISVQNHMAPTWHAKSAWFAQIPHHSVQHEYNMGQCSARWEHTKGGLLAWIRHSPTKLVHLAPIWDSLRTGGTNLALNADVRKQGKQHQFDTWPVQIEDNLH